jgi:hypothetical protein
MSKVIIRILVVLLIILTLVLILLKTRSPFGRSNTSFAAESEKEITKIDLSQTKQRIVLEKKGENWVINGNYETRKSGIIFILRILKEMKIKSPVSEELFKTEISDKGIEPVKVKIYGNKRLLRSFLVYKTRSNNYGNIMKMREGAKPFIVSVPGNDNDIGSAFTMNELYWKPYTVFNFLPSEISSVDFENLSDTSNSFSVLTVNHRYILKGGNRNLSGWDTSLVSRFLTYFIRVPFESWALEMSVQDQKAVKSGQPLYRITVNSQEGKKTILTLWERMSENSNTADSDRLLGKTEERDELFIIRYFDIDPLLKKRSYFFPK